MKNLKYLFAILLIAPIVFFSCNDDEEDKLGSFLTLKEVSIKQTVNDKETFTLETIDAPFTYSTIVTFINKPINWMNPTIQLEFEDILDIEKSQITLSDANGKEVGSIDIALEDNLVTAAFRKENDSYNYMSGMTYTLKITAKLKQDATEEQLRAFEDTGISTQAQFHTGKTINSISSNSVLLYLPEFTTTFDIKGDPRNSEYKYQLNVVYFVPSDVNINANYKERVSEILLRHQLFTMKWMKHWGYEEKSFGLPLDEEGMVDIVVVKGEGKQVDYPYSSGVSVPKMKNEITKHYAQNQLKFLSEHTLVITAVNSDIIAGEESPSTPFYGYGRWCFALDFPRMGYDLYNIDPITGEAINSTPLKTNLIGGLLHEMFHGLNMPHVGPSYSQKNDPAFGITLMGSGNTTYGKKPTFMHHASAAILNNCQVASFEEKTFYDSQNAQVNINDIIINGGECTVKGDFVSDINVTDVIVRFFNSTETFLGGSHGYTSVAFVTKPKGDKFEVTIPIEELKVNNYNYRIGVTILQENGNAKSTSYADTYKQENNTLVNTTLNREGWSVTLSHDIPVDAAISNAPMSLIDGDPATCLSMVKPGKSYEGVSVPAGEKVYAIIDMTKETEFNQITILFRSDNINSFLRPHVLSFYGSNDNQTYQVIKEENTLDVTKGKVEIKLDKPAKCRYLKVTFDKWDEVSGSTMQLAELLLQKE